MTTILPPQLDTELGEAQLMTGYPCTETGERMLNASWYRVSRSATAVSYIVISLHGAYRCTPTGRVHDFFDCLHDRRAVDTHADVLRALGFGVAK